MSNLAAARSGDRQKALEVLRDTLAETLDQCDPNVRPQVAAQYRATLAELGALTPKGKSVRDELKAKREARSSGRGAAAAGGSVAGRGRKS